MEALSIYVLKSAGLLSLFYVVYYLLLRNETNFTTNRKFLLSGIFASAILPSIEFTYKKIVSASAFSTNESLINAKNINNITAASSWNFFEVFGIFYLLLTVFFLLKLIFQLLSVRQLIKADATEKSPIQKNTEEFSFIPSKLNTQPFSFFNYIVYNPELHDSEELKIILTHEKIHCQQYHSIDIVVANICTALLWFNPLTWYYKKSISQNLEFIADREALAITSEKKKYQFAMLNATTKNINAPLTNNFHQSFIKRRIIMLNKTTTPGFSSWKISCVLPLLLAFMLIFNVKTEAQTKDNTQQDNLIRKDVENYDRNKVHTTQRPGNPIYILNGEVSKKSIVQLIAPKNISSVNVLKGESATTIYGAKASDGAIVIVTKDSKTNKKNSKYTPKPKVNNANSASINLLQKHETQTESKNQSRPSHISKLQSLIILDGKKQDRNFKIEELNPNDIVEINVLKGKAALEKYSKEGSNGVLEIKTK